MANAARPADDFDGITLQDYVEKNGPLTVDELMSLARPVAAGLEAAHAKNVLHRDIRPANVLVKRLPDQAGRPRWQVKLKPPEAGGAANPDFAPPELLGKVDATVDKPADIYSFGKTCCFALFRTTQPLPSHWKSVPEALADLLERTLAENPQERPVSFAVVARCFARIQQPEVVEVPMLVTAMPATPARKPLPAPARRRDDEPEYRDLNRGRRLWIWLLAGGSVAALLLAGLIVGIILIAREADRPESSDRTVAENTTTSSPSRPVSPPRSESEPRVNNPPAVGVSNPPDRPRKTYTIVFKGVPNSEYAAFLHERLKASLVDAANPGDWATVRLRIKGRLVRPPGAADDAPAVTDKTLTETLEAEGADTNQVDEAIRRLGVGSVESAGNAIVVQLTEPAAPSRPANAPLPGRKLTRVQLQQIVLALRDTDRFKHETAEKLLIASSPSEDYQATIRTLLRGLAANEDDAVRALGSWGNDEDAGFLATLLESKGQPWGVTEPFTDAFLRLRSPSSVPVLVRHVANFFSAARCCQVLLAIGPLAEKGIQAGLAEKEPAVRLKCCQLLRDIGSVASVPTLKSAILDRDQTVADAAWESWRAIAYYRVKPGGATAGDVKPGPKRSAQMVGDAQVTILIDAAAPLQPTLALAANGNSFYTLARDGTVRRLDWDGTELAKAPAGGATMLGVCADGMALTGPTDMKLLDANTLDPTRSAPIDGPKWVAMTPSQNLAVSRSEAGGGNLRVLDMGSFSQKMQLPDSKLGLSGKADPALTADGRFVLTNGGGRLFRWRIDATRLVLQDSTLTLGPDGGRTIVSPDGKLAALFYADGNKTDASFPLPVPTGATVVLDATDLRKAQFAINHGRGTAALAFDAKGGAFAISSDGTLMRFGANGVKGSSYKLNGTPRQLVVAPDGDRALVLMDDKLLRVDLQKP